MHRQMQTVCSQLRSHVMVMLAVLAECGLAESYIKKIREELTLKSFLVKATTCNRRRAAQRRSINDARLDATCTA